jgi:16S rRNA (cytidine1402-2'-O)-methyltransferase
MTDDASLVLRAAASVAAAQTYPTGALYVVATPIGNLADITLRAVHVLSLMDAIACEDTRQSGVLLRHLGIDKPLLALHQHNEREGADAVVLRLRRGERVAFVTDAGTPCVSDPGALLVAQVSLAGLRCLPIPGACSAAAALSVAGDVNAAGFEFLGFAAARSGERTEALQRAAASDKAQVMFEAPHRIEALARSLASSCPGRRVTLCRELTKQFETVVTLAAAELPGWFAADANRRRGEFVLVLHAPASAPAAAESTADDAMLKVLLAELALKQAVAIAAKLCGTPRNALYARALALQRAQT